jgi:hypothetical protein
MTTEDKMVELINQIIRKKKHVERMRDEAYNFCNFFAQGSVSTELMRTQGLSRLHRNEVKIETEIYNIFE